MRPSSTGSAVLPPYLLPDHIASRSISFENPSGAKGEGGRAASGLGPGCKGDPMRVLAPGAVIGVRPLAPHLWGEGEVKVWLDGEEEPPTLVGAGLEGYVGHAFGIQANTAPFKGCAFRERADAADTGRVSLCRWRLADAVYWREDGRVTMQQVGCRISPRSREAHLAHGLYERQDGVAAAAFWYESAPGAPLPAMPSAAARLADLPPAAGPASYAG